ncbi:MAG: site-specific integrase [Ammonifex sp.]|nr:MAG: site-specific integrase [Ammonifex sp.]
MKEIRKGTWLCKIYLGKDARNKKRYKTVTLRGTERDVQRRLRDIADRERARGQLPVSSRTTLAAFLEFWMTKYGEKQLRPDTVENYRSIIRNHIAPEIGDLPLEKLGWQHCDDLYDRKLKEGLSTRTVRLIHSILHRTLGWAAHRKRGILFENPADAATPPALEQREIKPLNLEQTVKLLRSACDDPYYGAFVLGAAEAGRRGEILGLAWENVDLEKGIIRISQQIVCLKGKVHFQPPKTKRSNDAIRISEEVAEILRRHRQTQQEEKLLLGEAYQDHGLVFATKLGTPVNPRNFIRHHFKPALKRAGLPPTTRFHDLRHTAATLMPANNEDVATISEKLRHARRSTTVDMYIHSATDAQYRASKRLASQLLEPDGSPKKEPGQTT